MSEEVSIARLGVRLHRKEESASEPHVLRPGDKIEYGITHEVVTPDGSKFWVRFGADTHVVHGEDPVYTAQRMADYVHVQIEKRVIEAVAATAKIAL